MILLFSIGALLAMTPVLIVAVGVMCYREGRRKERRDIMESREEARRRITATCDALILAERRRIAEARKSALTLEER